MKLCRFRLADDNNTIHTGIYKDGKIYQTEGLVPVSVHEFSNIELLKPTGTPLSVRKYESFNRGTNNRALYYSYGNPTNLLEPGQYFQLNDNIEDIDITVRIGCVIQQPCLNTGLLEIPNHILGFLPIVEVISRQILDEEQVQGLPACRGNDIVYIPGPIIITTDECYPEKKEDSLDNLTSIWNVSYSADNNEIGNWNVDQGVSFVDMIKHASHHILVHPGEMLLSPPLNVPSIKETSLKRYLQAGDSLSIKVGDLGIVQVKLL